MSPAQALPAPLWVLQAGVRAFSLLPRHARAAATAGPPAQVLHLRSLHRRRHHCCHRQQHVSVGVSISTGAPPQLRPMPLTLRLALVEPRQGCTFMLLRVTSAAHQVTRRSSLELTTRLQTIAAQLMSPSRDRGHGDTRDTQPCDRDFI